MVVIWGIKMKKYIKISQSEKFVMDEIWKCDRMVTVSDMVSILNSKGENWAYQTVATFLKRLEGKGLIDSTKKSNVLYYYPLISRQEYKNIEAKSFVNNSFGGSLKKFLTAFSNDDKLSNKDLDDLKEWFKDVDNK